LDYMSDGNVRFLNGFMNVFVFMIFVNCNTTLPHNDSFQVPDDLAVCYLEDNDRLDSYAT